MKDPESFCAVSGSQHLVSPTAYAFGKTGQDFTIEDMFPEKFYLN